jgi:hypothetical protein
MTNPFKTRSPSLSGPSTDLVPVTPDDAADLASVALSLYVETGGALRFTSVAGQVRTVAVADNAILPVGVLRVHASGTTAAGIHAFTV